MERPAGPKRGGGGTPRPSTWNVIDFDELRLADASVAGDCRAFEQLYTHYYPKVRGFCLRKTSDPQLAEDIAQEAFTRAFARISDFGGPKHFGGWVGTIASNLITDHYRRKYNDDVPLDTDEERGNAPVYEMDPVRRFQETDTARLVREALGKLEDRQRAAILMHEVRGLTCAAVGDHLGISEVAAESLLARARRRLRKELTKQMTAKAAPAAVFNLGGVGLLPVLFRGWRRLKSGAIEKANAAQVAVSRGFEQVGQVIPAGAAAKGLVAAVGTALVVHGAGAGTGDPATEMTEPAAETTHEPLPADGDPGSMIVPGDEQDAGGVELPGASVDVDLGEDGLGAEGSVDVPGGDENDPAGSLDVRLRVGLGEEGEPAGGIEVTVRDTEGDPVLETGDVEVDGG